MLKRKVATLLLAILLVFGLLPSSAGAITGFWGHLTPDGGAGALLDIAYGNATWVSVGKMGAVITSADGETWTPRTSATEADLRSVAFGNGMFVAVGKEIVSSTNGAEWKKATVSAQGTFTSVLYAAGKFSAANDQGQVYDSTDGSSWTLAKSWGRPPFEPGPQLQSITYANGFYVAIDPSGRLLQYGSRQWEDSQGWGSECSRILYLGGRFLGLCSGMVFTGTPDGRQWDRRDSKTYVLLNDAIYDGRRYLAVGESGAIVSSPDGVNWTELAKPRQAPDYYAIEYANGLYVVAGDDGRIWTSKDGSAWTQKYGGVQVDLAGVAEARNLVVAVGADGAIFSSSSPWPWKWLRRFTGTTQPLHSVAAGTDLFVAVGDHGTVLTSADAKTWTTQPSGTAADLQSVIFAGGRFVAAGNLTGGKAVILTSVDGLTWKAQQIDGTGIRGVAFGQGKFVLVGAGGLILTSPDGVAWTRAKTPSQADLHGVAFGAGKFLAVGGASGAGVALTSTDGSAWSKADGAGTQPLYGVAYAGDRFFVVGGKGSTGYTSDGAQLVVTDSTGSLNATSGDLRSVSVQGSRLTAVGTGGTIQWWQLPNSSLSTTKVSASRVKVGDKVSVTAVMKNDDGRTQSSRSVTLLQEPALFQSNTGTVTTDYNGEARFELKATQGGTATITAVAEDGTRLGTPVTVTVEAPVAEAPSCGFSDVLPSHPSCAAIKQLAALKVITGFEDGFHPEQGLTRAELATMLVRALKLPVAPGEPANFTDVKGHWAVTAGYLQAAVKAGAFNGNPDGTFQPDAAMTRAQLVKVVAAAAKLKASGVPSYTDVTENDWFAGWLSAAEQGRLIGGGAPNPVFTGRQFQSELPATRVEAAAVLANLLAR